MLSQAGTPYSISAFPGKLVKNNCGFILLIFDVSFQFFKNTCVEIYKERIKRKEKPWTNGALGMSGPCHVCAHIFVIIATIGQRKKRVTQKKK